MKPSVAGLAPGSHACWLVGEGDDYVEMAAAFLGRAVDAGEKPVAFGPEGSAALDALRPFTAITADPRVAFLDGGPLEPSLMFAMFDAQTALARSEGYRGIRLVADMDWLLPAQPSAAEVTAFELLLDREARRLGATIVCAYHAASFDPQTLAGTRCVHPLDIADDDPPQFQLVAGEGGWRLAGEVDVAVATDFGTAIHAALGSGECTLDVSSLRFIDVAGLRQIAEAGRAQRVRIVKPSQLFRRCWEAAEYGALAPSVELVG